MNGSAPDRPAMDGPEHWREADLIMVDDPCEYGCPHSGCVHEMRMIARAQVHATLALAAAHIAGVLMHPEDRAAWDRATRRPKDDEEVRPCRAHPDDCPNGPEPHAYHPPELEGLPCCVQPGEEEPF